MALFLILQHREIAVAKAPVSCLREHFSEYALLARQGNRTLQTRFDRIA
jgi:hypothetical protein